MGVNIIFKRYPRVKIPPFHLKMLHTPTWKKVTHYLTIQ